MATGDNAKVTYGFTKHLWANGEKENAFRHLSNFVNQTLQREPNEDTLKLLARCYLRLGEWQESLEGLNENVIQLVLRYFGNFSDI